jgi:transposase
VSGFNGRPRTAIGVAAGSARISSAKASCAAAAAVETIGDTTGRDATPVAHVAVNPCGTARGRYTTLAEHMVQAPRRGAEWTIGRIGREAAAIGTAASTPTQLILVTEPHPEQGFRACLGILCLVRTYGRDRVEAACAREL